MSNNLRFLEEVKPTSSINSPGFGHIQIKTLCFKFAQNPARFKALQRNANGSLIRFIPMLPIPPFARWAWYELENKLQTPYGTSSPHISWVFFRDCSSSQCAHHTWVAFCIFSFLPSWAFLRWSLRTEVAGVSGNSTLRYFGFDPMEAADCGSSGRTLTALWRDKPPGAVMFQWQTSG